MPCPSSLLPETWPPTVLQLLAETGVYRPESAAPLSFCPHLQETGVYRS